MVLVCPSNSRELPQRDKNNTPRNSEHFSPCAITPDVPRAHYAGFFGCRRTGVHAESITERPSEPGLPSLLSIVLYLLQHCDHYDYAPST